MSKLKPLLAPVPSSHRDDAREIERLRPALLRWFGKNARDLPWRKPFRAEDPLWRLKTRPRRHPYATWISEIMLQQTQVTTVIPYFEKWLARFPTPAALAEASEEEVLRHWAGLGYYARARNLQRGARLLSESGRYPDSAEGWRALPGVGPYTAGAVASLALDFPEAILDGNVIRVLSRVFGWAFLPGDGARQRDAYWELAALWPRGSRPGDVNEALMELGALVCAPANPRCGECPLASGCRAKAHGWQEVLPPAKRRAPIEAVLGVALVAHSGNNILMEVRGGGAFLAGHHLFPLFLGEEAKDWTRSFAKRFSQWQVGNVQEAGLVNHSIMNRRYVLKVVRATLRAPGKRKSPVSGVEWMKGSELEENLTNSLARKIWKRSGMPGQAAAAKAEDGV